MHDQDGGDMPGIRFAENLEAERNKLADEILAVADDLVARDDAEDGVAAELAELRQAQEAFYTLANDPETQNDPALCAELAAFGDAIAARTAKLLPQIMALDGLQEQITTRAHQLRGQAVILDIGIDLTLPDDIPAPTAEEMRLLAPHLPPDFGKQSTRKPKKPAASSLTTYSEKISMRIPRPILALLKEEAKRRGVPYQTFMNMVLGQHATGGGRA